MIIISFLHSSDKNFKKIQQIDTSTKTANIAKLAIG